MLTHQSTHMRAGRDHSQANVLAREETKQVHGDEQDVDLRHILFVHCTAAEPFSRRYSLLLTLSL